MPELSVILPARNAEGTVEQAVRSTLRAMPRDAELVVLNDRSSDRTGEVLGAIDDRRLRVIEGPGEGVGAALTMLLEKTDSRWVARMDADDITLPWRFADARRALRAGADLVFAPTIELRGRIPVPSVPLSIRPDAFGLHLLLTNPVSHPTLVARRAALDEVGGYRNVPSEDYDLWLRCAAAGQTLRRVWRWGLIYRIHPGQVTASDQWRKASWHDPRQAAAFAEASERVVGRRLTRLVQLGSMQTQERDVALAQFRAAVEPAVAAVPGIQGAFLRRRLAARLAWVEQLGPAGPGRGTVAGGESR